jgi:hypothetical protein
VLRCPGHVYDVLGWYNGALPELRYGVYRWALLCSLHLRVVLFEVSWFYCLHCVDDGGGNGVRVHWRAFRVLSGGFPGSCVYFSDRGTLDSLFYLRVSK